MLSKALRYGTISVLISLTGVLLLAAVMWLLPFKDMSPLAPPEATAPGFIVLGDWGEGDYRQRRVAALMEHACRAGGVDFIQSVGDNFYPDGVQSPEDPFWQTHFEAIYDSTCLAQLPFYAAFGNHDYGGKPDAQLEYALAHPNRWKMPGAWYVHRHGLFTIAVLDTNQSIEAQRQFLHEAFTGDTSSWRIVAGHHNVRTLSAKYHDDVRLQQAILEDLKALGVHFYLSGHSHNLQLLAYPGEPLYVVSGGGGKSPRGMLADSQAPFLAVKNGFAALQFTDTEALVSFTVTSGEFLTSFASETVRFSIDRACLSQVTGPECIRRLPAI
ncbi:MAG: metallophosphoesterase [Pseudomonadota bacterium]